MLSKQLHVRRARGYKKNLIHKGGITIDNKILAYLKWKIPLLHEATLQTPEALLINT